MKRILFILGTLEDEDIDWLVSTGRRRALSKDEVLIQEGKPAHAIHLILSGKLIVSVQRPHPTEIAYLSSGEVVGEMSFIDHLPPSATVTAAEPAVVLAVDWEALNSKLQQDLAFANRFYRALAMLLSTRLRSTVRHLESEYWHPVSIDEKNFSQDMAESLTLGGIRFDWLMRRLRDADVESIRP